MALASQMPYSINYQEYTLWTLDIKNWIWGIQLPSTTVAIIVTVFSVLIQVWLISIKLELNICKLHRKTPALECIFNKVHEVSSLKACKFIKKLLQHRYFPWNFAKSLRTVFLKNASGGCLSYLAKQINKIVRNFFA